MSSVYSFQILHIIFDVFCKYFITYLLCFVKSLHGIDLTRYIVSVPLHITLILFLHHY